jgi:drug/metabolite transporter (DMT)-like permease
MQDTVRPGAWVAFFVLGIIWGSSFLLIRVGVDEIQASQVVFIRCLIAAVGLNTVLLLRGKRLPLSWSHIRAFTLIGLGNAAVPYLLITLGEQTVESNMASVLQATASMFALVIAHFAFSDERMTVNTVLGLLLGFVGVVLLASRSEPETGTNTLIGQFAIIGASLLYAIFTVYSRNIVRERLEPIMIAAGNFIPATIFSGIMVFVEPLFGGRAPVDLLAVDPNALQAVLLLGVLNTFIAYLFFYYIVQQLGAFRATNVTYIVPVVGVILGWLVLGESMDWRLLLGAGLIFLGLGMINLGQRLFNMIRRRSTPIAPHNV